MRLAIHAIGRLKSGAERELCDEYARRIRGIGPQIGFRSFDIEEHAPATTPEKDARALLRAAPDAAIFVALDERGDDWTSEAFAAYLRAKRDDGAPAMTFIIGGADGLHQSVRSRADRVLRFGRATWPHKLVRVMLAEQIYRAFTMLAGHPYHRE